MAKCSDYGDRRGCGAEIMLIKIHRRDGKEQFMPFDRCFEVRLKDGSEVMGAFIPHWLTCPEAEDKRAKEIAYMRQREEKFQAGRLNKDGNGNGNGGGEGKRGGDFRRASERPDQRQSANRDRGTGGQARGDQRGRGGRDEDIPF